MDIALKQFEVACNGDIFWDKLCSENSWNKAYASQVYSEYKRFLWLAKAGKQRIVPSKDVDKVWHLHMTFTESYWFDLCDTVLGFKLHHVPSSANTEAAKKDSDDYCQTLALYHTEFGSEAPKRIWPQADTDRLRMPDIRSNTGQCIERYLGIIFIGVFVLAGCSLESDHELFTYVKWTIAIYIIYRFLKWLSSHSGGNGGGGGGSGCGSSCGSSCGGGD